MKRKNYFGFMVMLSVGCLLIGLAGCGRPSPANEDVTGESVIAATTETAAKAETTETVATAEATATTASTSLPPEGSSELSMPEIKTSLQIKSLRKLCEVWGYAKYHHPAFLLGPKKWDEELLRIMPSVLLAEDEENVNAILYDWFMELGEIDYGTYSKLEVPAWANANAEDIIVQADTSWTEDTSYLGKPLSDALQQLGVIPNIGRVNAPVDFIENGLCVFQRENSYTDMNFADARYRLLGLFRYWNAIEYFYPYLDVFEEDWHELLSSFIPKMAEGEDKHSYEGTLTELSARLRDAHLGLMGGAFLIEEFGPYAAPVRLTKAEGKLVVLEVCRDLCETECPLMAGDVLVNVDGVDIDDRIKMVKKYVPANTDEKLLGAPSFYILRSHDKAMKITVLRDGTEQDFTVECTAEGFSMLPACDSSHEILENNIGLINPSKLEEGELDKIMEEFSETDGLIVDLRQYPKMGVPFTLEKYLLDKTEPFVMISKPSIAVPGTFIRYMQQTEYDVEKDAPYFYPKKVVLLMNEQSQSAAEFFIMELRGGPNVTVMGENSIGSNGNVAGLPLPGGGEALLSAIGIYNPDGGRTHRIGLTPDIYVERTIAGVKEGRDEYIEAAVQYLSGQN